jgi:hypothetical protein
MLLPGLPLTGVESERQRGSEREAGILAEVVVARGVPHLHGSVLHGVEHLQSGNDLARGEHLDLEFVVCDLGDALGHELGTAVQGVERFRPTRGQAPLNLRHGLRDGRRSDCRAGEADTGRLQEFTTLHGVSPRVVVGPPTRGELVRRIPAAPAADPAIVGPGAGKRKGPEVGLRSLCIFYFRTITRVARRESEKYRRYIRQPATTDTRRPGTQPCCRKLS